MDTTFRHHTKLYRLPPWQMPIRRSTSFEPQQQQQRSSSAGSKKKARQQQLRQLQLTEMKDWITDSLNFKKRARCVEGSCRGGGDYEVLALPPSISCSGAATKPRRQVPYITHLPSDMLGVVADYFCDGVDDVVLFGRVSKWWFACVIHSFMWKERVAQLTSRNPFPVNERDHHKWHFDVTNASHISLVRSLIQVRLNGKASWFGSFNIWLHHPNWIDNLSSFDENFEWLARTFFYGLFLRNEGIIVNFKHVFYYVPDHATLSPLDVHLMSDFVTQGTTATVFNGGVRNGESLEPVVIKRKHLTIRRTHRCGFYKPQALRALDDDLMCPTVVLVDEFVTLYASGDAKHERRTKPKQLELAMFRTTPEAENMDVSTPVHLVFITALHIPKVPLDSPVDTSVTLWRSPWQGFHHTNAKPTTMRG